MAESCFGHRPALKMGDHSAALSAAECSLEVGPAAGVRPSPGQGDTTGPRFRGGDLPEKGGVNITFIFI